MGHTARDLKFLVTPKKGDISAVPIRPKGASHPLVLGHGASTTMRLATLQAIAEAGIAAFWFNLPYADHGKGSDSQAAHTEASRDLRLLNGGRSFGGRMTSTAASESPVDGVCGLVFYSLPLHQPGN